MRVWTWGQTSAKMNTSNESENTYDTQFSHIALDTAPPTPTQLLYIGFI